MGSPVFDGNSLVSTLTKSFLDDNSLPDTGSLSLGLIASDSALKATDGELAGRTGLDGTLVHGGLWQDVDGDLGTVCTGEETHHTMKKRSLTIDGSDVRYIKEQLKETVDGDAEIIYLKGRSLNVFIKDEVNILGARDLTITGLDTEDYSMPREINEPIKFETVPTDMGYKGFILEISSFKIESCLGIHLEATRAHLGAMLTEVNLTAQKMENDPVELKLGGIRSVIKALFLGTGVRVNAGPRASIPPISG
jgi:hypothetical protein